MVGMTQKSPKSDLEGAERLMGALVRMKPKPHEEMKIGKAKKQKKPKAKKST
jgi:hypothetical protein